MESVNISLNNSLTSIFLNKQTTQKELEEQEQRLQRLHQLGEDLIEESGNDEETKKDIEAQLQDFDDCWNHVAKRVIDEKQKVWINILWFLIFTNLLTYHFCIWYIAIFLLV